MSKLYNTGILFLRFKHCSGRVDVLHCSSLLRVCASSEGWFQALSLLTSTRRHGVQMDEVAWNAMLSATKARLRIATERVKLVGSDGSTHVS